MMLAGLPVPADAVDGLAELVRTAGADDVADRLERALADEVKLLALNLDERALLLALWRIRRSRSPSCAPSCSPTISGGEPKVSTEARGLEMGAGGDGGTTGW